MDSRADYYPQQSTLQQTTFLEEQILYDHLLERVKVETPEELLVRFWTLFISGSEYSDYQVWQAFQRMVHSPFISKDFKFILNRSAYILINHWLMQPRCHSAIPELVALFESMPLRSRSRSAQRLQELVRNFTQTEQYLALQRLAQVVAQPPEWGSNAGVKPLGTLIRRYPCLYEYNLLTEDSTSEQRRRVRQIRRQVQQQFEQDLVRYTTHKLLACESFRGSILDGNALGGTPLKGNALSGSRLSASVLSASSTSALSNISDERSPVNPTLLSDRRLSRALQQFGGKVDGYNTYRDLAERFRTYGRHATSYRAFKQDLYEYLTESIGSRYGKLQFNQRLYNYLESTLDDHDDQQLNDVLLVCTCRKLLNFLVVESPQKPNHTMFVDLTGNLGITATIGLLLKIVLLCRNVRPYLEKQFAILFNHYESCTRDGVTWLIDALENLNVALSLNFGRLSL